MNHCLLEVTVKVAPTIRYTQDNQTAIAEMEVAFEGLRADDPTGTIKAIGWGNMAQDLQSNAQVGQKLILEGRLRMNTVPRQDGSKEKKAEFTISKLHSSTKNPGSSNTSTENFQSKNSSTSNLSETPLKQTNNSSEEDPVTWNSAPLIPDTDEIPF